MAKALVTGASGRIGKLLVRKLKQHGIPVVGMAGPQLPWPKGADLARVDLTQFADWLVSERISTVFHCAGVLQGTSEALFAGNVGMATTLAESIGKISHPDERPLLISLGSAAELGQINDAELPVGENFVCHPESSYGQSKLKQTKEVLAAGKRFGFRVLVLRIFNLLWLPLPSNLPVQSWIVRLLQSKAAGESNATLEVGDLSLKRDFIDTDDLIEIIVEISRHPTAAGLIHVGSGTEFRLQDILDSLCRMLQVSPEIRLQPKFLAPHTAPRVRADIRLLESLLKRQIRFDLDASLKRAIEATLSDSRSI